MGFMASSRSSSARSQSGSTPLLTFVKGLFYLVLALVLSFALGFYVISKLIPQTGLGTGNSGAGALNAKSDSSISSITNESGQKSSPPAVISPPSQSPAVTPHSPAAGPTLLPEDDVQKPAKLDDETRSATDNGDSQTNPKADGGAATENQADSQTAAPGAATKSHRRTDEDVQTPSAIDRTITERPGTTAANPATTAPKSSLYRVQLGVFSTRDKAEEVAALATDKGFTTSIRVVTRDGRTLYRVQHSTHRDRTKAVAELQKLTDAGLEASIINPE